ncbi:GNAT family N-acetyltransferase [Actinorhabdospora filicis]|uniref:GNAT family N-acetyltransferase n=1 Tax=Actinorhabdospora filicis TaxID=1785913 RepID=A0A9W6SJF0_9ACTN|nr:GNAT family N-acetyltransferase [Actinorhabdospora filicis]GLZ77052.1 GNAT family N-acetyltransferase [Actinorhabdospora filicis]
MRIEPLHVHDDSVAMDVFALESAHKRHDLPEYAELFPEVAIARYRADMPGSDIERWGIRVDGELAGFAELTLPTIENLQNAHVEGFVHPSLRRRGIATALYAHCVSRAQAMGRTKLSSFIEAPAPDGVEHADGAGVLFLERAGLRRVLDEVRRRLDLGSLDTTALAKLRADAEAAAEGYRLVSWTGPAAGELAEGLAYLEGRLIQDAPTGELEWEPEKYDADRWRATEAMTAARLRTQHTTAALAPGGEVVAWTGLLVAARPRTDAYQITTIVDPAHRGRRLGTLVKLANLDHARAAEPELARVYTYNAADNTHMIAVNEAMGFKIAHLGVNFQGDIPK